MNSKLIASTIRALVEHGTSSDWKGYDPYDALNSKFFQLIPCLDWKLPRLVITQVLKRSPINLRRLLLVPQTQNPKGLALVITALSKLDGESVPGRTAILCKLAKDLLKLRTPNETFSVWGYNFPWQTRTKLVPLGSPNIICTTFAANALLDLFQQTCTAEYAEYALSSARFLLDRLYAKSNGVCWFNYTLHEQTQIHNANLLGAALLARAGHLLDKPEMLEAAHEATRFSIARQNADGSWYYGERRNPSQLWIDSFHTGFNLCALRTISEDMDVDGVITAIENGLDYYSKTFFGDDGAPYYFNTEPFPYDIHSAAQGIITFSQFSTCRPEHIKKAELILSWTLEHLWDHRGYFYYQKKRWFTNRTPYFRWSQAWMLLALASLDQARKKYQVFAGSSVQ